MNVNNGRAETKEKVGIEVTVWNDSDVFSVNVETK